MIVLLLCFVLFAKSESEKYIVGSKYIVELETTKPSTSNSNFIVEVVSNKAENAVEKNGQRSEINVITNNPEQDIREKAVDSKESFEKYVENEEDAKTNFQEVDNEEFGDDLLLNALFEEESNESLHKRKSELKTAGGIIFDSQNSNTRNNSNGKLCRHKHADYELKLTSNSTLIPKNSNGKLPKHKPGVFLAKHHKSVHIAEKSSIKPTEEGSEAKKQGEPVFDHIALLTKWKGLQTFQDQHNKPTEKVSKQKYHKNKQTCKKWRAPRAPLGENIQNLGKFWGKIRKL